jgi:uncharacterized membrane protein
VTERLHKWREDILTSLWFIPVLCGAIAIALSFLMPAIDNRVEQDLEDYRTWIFLGSASAARSILAAIAQSLITVISLLFSITILTMHQASVQYTPRVIRNFVRDRANQVILGTYLGTFLYAILIMRRIRGEDAPGPESVPMLSITVALFLAMICLMLLVLFIHHSAVAFQASTIVERVHTELVKEMDALYPTRIGEPAPEEEDDLAYFRRTHSGPTTVIPAHDSGFLRFIDDGTITACLRNGEWAIVQPCVGNYVSFGQPLIEVGGATEPINDRMDQFRSAFILDSERTISQDLMYGFRQLADIALKGLSPSIHDPTTAEHAIAAAGDALAHLALRQFPDRTRVVEMDEHGQPSTVTLWLNRPDFAAYVDVVFSQVRRVARDNVHVTAYLLDTLHNVARSASDREAQALQVQIDEILWYLDTHATFSLRDQALIRERATHALRLI